MKADIRRDTDSATSMSLASPSCIGVTEVAGDVQLRANFTCRPFGHEEKPGEVFVAPTLETFRNVGHDGNTRPSNLIA
jgi:hypothetical protein